MFILVLPVLISHKCRSQCSYPGNEAVLVGRIGSQNIVHITRGLTNIDKIVSETDLRAGRARRIGRENSGYFDPLVVWFGMLSAKKNRCVFISDFQVFTWLTSGNSSYDIAAMTWYESSSLSLIIFASLK